eukprot:symbB.v1.2.012054.t1/scaffold824.1/size159532/5
MVLLMEVKGSSQVLNFSFVNLCEDDIFLKDWDVIIPARGFKEVEHLRHTGLQRISWRYVEGPWDSDFIELNGNWPGVGVPMYGHPNYASWCGFSMSSRYEALDPKTGTSACSDAAAELKFSLSTCPSRRTLRYGCDFFATQESIRNCSSDFALYIKEHSWTINPDGTRSRQYASTKNIINYWCAPESSSWKGWGVGSFIDCTTRDVPIHFRVTTCISFRLSFRLRFFEGKTIEVKMAAKKPAAKKGTSKSMKALKKPAATSKKPAAKTATKKPATKGPSKPSGGQVPKELKELEARVVNLERRPDRWKRVATVLKKELPWLNFERFLASDGSKMTIPEEEVALKWNTSKNANFADFYEWAFEDGTTWMWAADAPEEDDTWKFTENGEGFSYIRDAPTFHEKDPPTGTLEKKATGEKFTVTLRFAKQYLEPGETQMMSGGERGCAHSHRRLWEFAATRSTPTLVLEDDVHIRFDRNGDKGKMNGKVFTKRLVEAIRRAPSDFDVIYLGWSGWRGGNFKLWKADDSGLSEVDRCFLQKAEYVWTTVAYVISQAGAKKLLEVAAPIDQPVDNFMAWQASQGLLKSFVALDEGDEDSTWAGGIVDQFDFQGDSDIKKSDGGHQGDDAKEFAAEPEAMET